MNFNMKELVDIDAISIIDISGKVITPQFDLISKTIDVSNLQSGVYFVRFESNGQYFTKKFSKQ